MADEEIKKDEETKETDEPKKRKMVTEEGIFEVTDDEYEKLALLGLTKAIKESKKEEPKKEEPKKEDIKVDNDRVAKLEKKLEEFEAANKQKETQSKEAQLLRFISKTVADNEIPEDFRDEVEEAIVGKWATARSQGGTVDLGEIIKTKIAAMKIKLAKYKKTVDVDKKEETSKKMGALTGTSKGAGEEDVKPLTRKSFRDGSLVKRITDRLKNLTE